MAPLGHAKPSSNGQNKGQNTASVEDQKRELIRGNFNQLEWQITQPQGVQTPSQQMAGPRGGWSGTGGGGGVQCYSSRVQALDYFEFENQRWVLPYQGESAGSFIDRLLKDYFSLLSPFFTAQLEIALMKIQARPWIPYVNIPDTKDKGRIARSFGSVCQSVQLAARTLDAQVYFDPNLMSQIYATNPHQIATLNMVILVLHEALYLMGVEMHHSNSASSRKVVAKLLEKDLYEMTTRFKGHRLAVLQTLFQQENFSYFTLLFGAVDTSNTTMPGATELSMATPTNTGRYSKATRRNSYVEYQKALDSISSAMSGYDSRVEAIKNFMDQKASDEIVFLYLARNEEVNPPAPIPFPHPENLLVDAKDDRAQIHALCDEFDLMIRYENSIMSTRSSRLQILAQRKVRILQKGMRYCSTFNLPRCPSYFKELGPERNLLLQCK